MPPDDDWYRPRPYPHFDPAVSREEAERVISDPDVVASHDFYPFIKRIDQTPQYRSEEGTVKHKARRICYAAHLDAHIYAYYAERLSKKYEHHIASRDFSESVVAYRSFREIVGEPKCNIDFAARVFAFIDDKCEPGRPLVALAFDVSSFFDNLNHQQLKTAWGEVLDDSYLPEDHYHIFRSLTKYAYVKQSRLRDIFPGFYRQSRSERRNEQICTAEQFRNKVRSQGHVIVNHHNYGIPQGTPISALLSNIYMKHFDRDVYRKVRALGGHYRRYSDDLMAVVPADRATEVKSYVMSRIEDLGLRIQERKTESFRVEHDGSSKTCIDRKTGKESAVQYLGFVFDGENIRIRPSSLTSFYRRMNGAVKAAANRALTDPVDAEGRYLHRRSLYERFSHLGDRNFISYAYRAAEVMDDVTGGDAIRSQVANHWKILHDRIEHWEEKIRAGNLVGRDNET
jgi:hypothetical protein